MTYQYEPPPICAQCHLPEPGDYCWNHSITCPFSKPLQGTRQDLLPALRCVIWLLAELKAQPETP